MQIMNRWVLEEDDAGRNLDTAFDDVHGGSAARPIGLPVRQDVYKRQDVNTTVVWGVHDNVSPVRVPNYVWETYLKNKPGRNRYWVVPGADHYLQCDAPEQLAQVVRLTAGGEDISLQTLGNQPDGAVLVDFSASRA